MPEINFYKFNNDSQNLNQASENDILFNLDGGLYIGNNSNIPHLIANKIEKISELENDANYITELDINNKQDKLISGVNIATINNQSLLNGGNITISAEYGTLTFDNEPLPNSTNLVNSGAIYNSFVTTDNKISKLANDVVDGTLASMYHVSISGNSATTDKINHDVLFVQTTPNYDNISLSNSAANYTFIDIYAQTSEGVMLFNRIYMPNNKSFAFNYNYINSSSFASIFKTYTISDSNLTCNESQSGSVITTQNNKHDVEQSNRFIGILAVLGYK